MISLLEAQLLFQGLGLVETHHLKRFRSSRRIRYGNAINRIGQNDAHDEVSTGSSDRVTVLGAETVARIATRSNRSRY